MNAAEILKQVPHHQLDTQVSDVHLEEIALKVVCWEDFAAYLALSKAEQEEIRRNHERNYRAQKRAALHSWKEKNGSHATYRLLIIVFCSAQKADLADVVKCLLLPQPIDGGIASDTRNVLKTFRSYLVDCYTQAHHPSQVGWPFSHTAAYVDLPLYEAPITEQELENQDKASPPKLVNFDKIFLLGSHKAKRKVILIEGVAGSGKTTLSWHASQKWAEGLLLQQFSLLIRVSLEDPAIHSASRLADIIPHPSEEFRKAVEKAIAEQHGKGVCFLFDGFDEAPPTLQQFIYNFLSGRSGRSNLPRCSIVVTSRPVASGVLYPLLTSKVVVGRLNRASIEDMLSAYLSSNEDDSNPKVTSDKDTDLEELIRMLDQNSMSANLCNLPINAAIVIHLFRCGHRKLPETRTGLFKALVRNLLLRHIHQRTIHTLQEIGDESHFKFEDLPGEIFDKFRALSSLAVKGIKQNIRVFTLDKLKGEGFRFPFDHLSLMEAHSTSFGFYRSFIFLHYSVQEFLAAWHMTRLSDEQQAKAVSDILSRRPLSPVLPFFAGLTGLSNPAVRDVLLAVTKHPLDKMNVLSNMPRKPSEDRRRLVLALLNCIHETQNPSMCVLVNPPSYPVVECDISLWALRLEPSDCLSVGFFMAHRGKCNIDLCYCRITEPGVEALLKPLRTPDTNAQVDLSLGGRHLLFSRSMRLLSQTIMKVSNLSALGLVDSWFPCQVASNLALLIAGLCRRSAPIKLVLSWSSITSEHAHLLVLLLTLCHCIIGLGLGHNDISEGMSLISAALAQNTSLSLIYLEGCNLQDEALLELGDVLEMHRSIRAITLLNNKFSSEAVQYFLATQFQSGLRSLDIGRSLNDEENSIYHQLCQVRAACSIEPLIISRSSEKTTEEYAIGTEAFKSLPPAVQYRLW